MVLVCFFADATAVLLPSDGFQVKKCMVWFGNGVTLTSVLSFERCTNYYIFVWSNLSTLADFRDGQPCVLSVSVSLFHFNLLQISFHLFNFCFIISFSSQAQGVIYCFWMEQSWLFSDKSGATLHLIHSRCHFFILSFFSQLSCGFLAVTRLFTTLLLVSWQWVCLCASDLFYLFY